MSGNRRKRVLPSKEELDNAWIKAGGEKREDGVIVLPPEPTEKPEEEKQAKKKTTRSGTTTTAATIIRLFGMGKTFPEIARKTGLSIKRVKQVYVEIKATRDQERAAKQNKVLR